MNINVSLSWVTKLKKYKIKSEEKYQMGHKFFHVENHVKDKKPTVSSGTNLLEEVRGVWVQKQLYMQVMGNPQACSLAIFLG